MFGGEWGCGESVIRIKSMEMRKPQGALCCDYMHDDPLSVARFILECHQAQSLLSSHLHLVILHIARAYLMKH